MTAPVTTPETERHIAGREPTAGLLLTRRFLPLLGCQFFADLADNFFLNTLTFLVLFKLGGVDGAPLIPLGTAVLIAPSFLLSALGGELADRFDMAVVAQRLRLAGLCVSTIAAIGLVVGSLPVMFASLLLFGVIAALFAPLKLGALPHLLAAEELPAGNAFMQGSIFTAVLFGTIAAGLLAKQGDPLVLAVLAVGMPLASWGASLMIPATGESAPGLVVRRNVLASTWAALLRLREDRRIAWCALAICWFWWAAATAMTVTPLLVKHVLGGAEEVLALCFALFSIGVAVGSGLAGWCARGRIHLRSAVWGALLIAIFATLLGIASSFGRPEVGNGILDVFGSQRGLLVAVALFGLAVSGGLYLVPLMTALQSWAGTDRRARVVAALNMLTAAFMAMAALAASALQVLGVTPPFVFLLLGATGLAVAAIVARTVPGGMESSRIFLRGPPP